MIEAFIIWLFGKTLGGLMLLVFAVIGIPFLALIIFLLLKPWIDRRIK